MPMIWLKHLYFLPDILTLIHHDVYGAMGAPVAWQGHSTQHVCIEQSRGEVIYAEVAGLKPKQ